MRLKSLKLSGFKSFANPTTFTFRHGITAIVGPNGCGKSNVIDAIRWVLGESSAKQLRGGAMSDVIFAGTQSKAAKSLASVELIFEHTQDEQTGIRHELNIYHELSVRRQINAEGKSDYFINGTRCRRRDVVDIFLGTGLGPRSYSVIQQGMIGRIVDSSPLQLREFIEEAAGVSRYQARREETQKKLLKTRENLERLTDIEAELTKQKKKLAKQAQSANEYEQVKAALEEVKEQLAIQQLYQAKSAQMQYKAEQAQLTEKLEAQQAEDATLKQRLAKSSARLAEEQWLKDDARDQLHKQDMQRQQVEHQYKDLQSTLSQLEGRLQGNQDRQQKLQASQQAAQQQNQIQNETLSRLKPELDALQTQQQQLTQKYVPLQAAWETSNAAVAKLEADKREVEQRIALNQQAQARLTLDKSKWEKKEAVWQQDAVKWGLATKSTPEQAADGSDASTQSPTMSSTLDSDINHINTALNSLDKQQESIDEQLETEQPVFNQLKQSLSEQQLQLTQLEKQHASLMAEYDTLHAIVHPKKPAANQQHTSDKTADSSPDSASSQLDRLSSLHEHIKLTQAGESYANILDQWLAFWLDTRLLVGTNGTLQTALSSESAEVLQPLLVAHYSDQQTNKADSQSNKEPAANSVFFASSTATTSTVNPQDLPASLMPLSQLIAAPKLAIWQQGYLYTGTDADTPLTELLEVLPEQAFILTASGWFVSRVGAVHLSKLNAAAHNESFLSIRLQQQQRLAVLEDSLNEIEDKMAQHHTAIKAQNNKQEQLAVVIEELSAQLSAITHKRHELQQQRVTLIAKQERQDSEQQRLRTQRLEIDNEYQELEQAQSQLTQKISEDTEYVEALTPKLQAAKQEQAHLEQQRQQISQQERDGNEALRRYQLEYGQAEIAAKHSSEQLAQYHSDSQQLERHHQKLLKEQAQAQAKLPQLQQDLATANAQHHEQQVALDERQAVITVLQTEVNNYQSKRDQLEQQRQQLQEQLSQSTTQVAIANERINEASERLKSLNSEVSPSALLTDYITHGRSVSEDKQQKLQAEESRLMAKLDTMGPVNLAAAAELAAVDERLLPLEQQIHDITASMDMLSDAIASIDKKTKTLFLDTLESVNESLTGLFTKVFGGGQASLTLVKEEGGDKNEQWRAGLELMAQPKGKKNSRLAVLSGGEKTLTALSLIFAIFKQHPAPFCVLDEVDAPLDDANVARFTHLIRDLADDVQFVFISHNKLAMQIADELKGITMPQAGISTLVSVSLEEAEQYLEPTA